MFGLTKNEKKQSKNDENEDRILKLLKELSAEVSVYAGKVGKIDQDIKTLRALVNRKLGQDFEEQTENVKSQDAFGSLREMNRQFPPV